LVAPMMWNTVRLDDAGTPQEGRVNPAARAVEITNRSGLIAA